MIVLRLSVVHLIERKHPLFPLQPQSLIGLVNLLEMIIHIVMCFLDMSDVQSIIREGKSCSHSQNIVTWLSIRVCQVRYNIFFLRMDTIVMDRMDTRIGEEKNTTYAQLRIGDLKENLLFQTIQPKIDRTEAIPDICHFLNYDKIHSKLPIFCVRSVKIYTGQKKFTRIYSWCS